ncbi:MAG: hypothetical protein Q4D02_01625 [Clostridia bacterium]|nr:hypothetical protein [Clostridia bacterium]
MKTSNYKFVFIIAHAEKEEDIDIGILRTICCFSSIIMGIGTLYINKKNVK